MESKFCGELVGTGCSVKMDEVKKHLHISKKSRNFAGFLVWSPLAWRLSIDKWRGMRGLVNVWKVYGI